MDPTQLFDMESLGQAGLVLTAVSAAITAVCMLACYYLAQRKGRSKVLGVVGGCVFGPFAVLHYLLLKPPMPGEAPESLLSMGSARPARRLSEEEAIARMVDGLHAAPRPAATVTPTLTPSPTPPPPALPPPPPLPLVRKCWSCGAPYEPEATACPQCGIKLDY